MKTQACGWSCLNKAAVLLGFKLCYFYLGMHFPFQKFLDCNKRRRKGWQFIRASKKVIGVSHVRFLRVILHKLPSAAVCVSAICTGLMWVTGGECSNQCLLMVSLSVLKIKSLTYWWSFQSCPGRDEEPELERFEQAAQLLPAAEDTSLKNKEE